MPTRIKLLIGKKGLESQGAIPKARMVRAEIPGVVQREQPRSEHSSGEAVPARYGFLYAVAAHVKQREHRSEAHDLRCRPDRQVWELVVGRSEVRDKDLIASLGFFPQ